jgi:hypothetical protein
LPNTLPLFAAFALISEGRARAVLGIVNVILAFATVPLAWRTLTAQEGRRSPGLSWAPVLVLSTVLFLSSTVYFCVSIGQLGLVVAVLVFAALTAQAGRSPNLAGIFLALAAIKINTVVPTLLLFHRRVDRPTWLALGGALLALTMVTTPPALLASRLHDNIELIRAYEQPGAVNDYAIENGQSHGFIGFEPLLYALGLRNRRLIRWLQYAALGLLGMGIVWLLARGKLSRGGACSLVLLYASIFLYHRTYDAVVLALPMLHAADRSRSQSGRARCWFAGCAACILVCLSLYASPLRALGKAAFAWPPVARILIHAIVLPSATWLILAALGLLVLGEQADIQTCPSELPRPRAACPGAVAAGRQLPSTEL